MKNIFITLICTLFFYSCAPVLSENLLRQGDINADLSEIRNNPVRNIGKLYIIGGVIVKTKVTKEGSLIEAIYVPVNSSGYLKNLSATNGRFLAIYKSKDLLDPLIFREKREVTIAAELIGTRKGMFDEIEYDYPFFEIKELYLWEEIKKRDYYNYPPYPYYPPWHHQHRSYDPYSPWY